jgi:purine-nucleoside phosphorylase
MQVIDEYEFIAPCVEDVRYKLNGFQPQVGIILGSGLGDLAQHIDHPIEIQYAHIPHFPISTVEGHHGKFVAGMFEQRPVIMMQGRFHRYEGYSMKQVVLPIYVMKQLGIKQLIVTNAAGGMNRDYHAGDLMVISDHINMTGENPLIGRHHASLGVRFPDMSQAYDVRLRTIAHEVARGIYDVSSEPLRLREGVYVGITGPTYMTSAELQMLHRIGGDALGMSTVAEVIAARHAGIDVLGISCITDLATGELENPLTHEQVIKIANQTKPYFIQLIKGIVDKL